MSLRVIHSYPIWLPRTQGWMHAQVRCLPGDIECHIVCETVENPDEFGLPNMHVSSCRPLPVSVWDRGIRKLGLRDHLSFLTSVAKSTGARLLHSHFGNIGWANRRAARACKMAHIVTFYGADVTMNPRMDACWRGRYAEMFGMVDRVLCEGPHMRAEVVALGCPPEKAVVHHLGVTLDEIPYEPRSWRPGEPLRVLITASFREKKGIPDAVRTLGRVQNEAELEVTIVGGATGEERSRAEERRILAAIEETGLGARVRLAGFLNGHDLRREAGRAHVFLSPSITASDGDTEGGAPVSIIEMAASGMAIVSTRHCDIPGVVLDGVTGYLAPEGDVDALAGRLLRLIEDPGGWRAMQDAGRRHIEENFDARTQGWKLAHIYGELMRS